MFFLTRKLNQRIASLQAQLAESSTMAAQFEARAIQAEQALKKMVKESQQQLSKCTEFSSAGEAAYAQANKYDECKQAWAEAHQDLWEHAACGAILFGRQHGADAQIAYFKLGARVPYALGGGPNEVMTAELTDSVHGGITLRVNGEYLRDLDVRGLAETIKWFSDLVTSPPGWLCV